MNNNKNYIIPKETIQKAAQEYLFYSITPPKQFNIKSTLGKWECEFQDQSGIWSEGFVTWCNDPKEVLNIFFGIDYDVSGNWDDSWND